MTVFFCGRKREPCDTPSCGRSSSANCQQPLPKIRRDGKLVDAPEGTVCGRPVCRHCSVEVYGKLLCLAHARFVGKGHGS